MKQENYSEAGVIVNEGETGDCLYLIVEGSVEVLKNVSDSSSESRERIATLGTGETFGEMAIVDLQKRSATVKTMEATAVLKLSHKDIFNIAQKNNYIYSIVIMNLAREISRRLRVMDDRYAITLFSHKH
jgi:CRP-like cAMP-binding protein